MDEVLAATLRGAVHERLNYLDMLVSEADVASLAALADTEFARLCAALRALLVLHEPDERGRCTQCSGWRRGRLFPCSVWVVAHEHLIATDRTTTPAGSGRHATTAASLLADARQAASWSAGSAPPRIRRVSPPRSTPAPRGCHRHPKHNHAQSR